MSQESFPCLQELQIRIFVVVVVWKFLNINFSLLIPDEVRKRISSGKCG